MKVYLGALGVLVYIMISYGVGLTHLPLFDRDEPRFAQGSREMVQSGNYIVPFFNGEPRYDKPPFIYWCQAFSLRMFGDEDFSTRLPPLLFTILTVGIIFAFGRRIFTPEIGLWASLVFAFSLHTTVLARAVVADMALTFFLALAFWAGWELLRPRDKIIKWNIWWWIFYLSLTFAFLTKGPIAVFPLIAIGLLRIILKDKQLMKNLHFGSGILLIFIIVATWAIPAWIETKGEYFYIGFGKHVLKRAFHAMEGHGGGNIIVCLSMLPFYFVSIFASFFPWSIYLFPLVKFYFKKENRSFNEIYLLVGASIFFILFSLAKTKLPHYTFPALPLLSILFVRYWTKAERSKTSLVRNICLMSLLNFLVVWILFPKITEYTPVRKLFLESSASLRSNMEFASAEFGEPSIVWYFGRIIETRHQEISLDDVSRFMGKPGPRCCIIPTKYFSEKLPTTLKTWQIYSSQGINLSKGNWIELTLLVKPE